MNKRRCSECERDIPEDEWGYGSSVGDWRFHVDVVRVSEDEQEQRLCGSCCQNGWKADVSFAVGSTTNLHPCSEGHDWQAVQRAHSGLGVLVVCRRCAMSRWVGTEKEESDGQG